MIFTTLAFLLFLPVVFCVHWSLRSRRARNVWLLLSSYFFYSCWDWRFLGLLLLSTGVDWTLANLISREPDRRGARRWVATSVVVNLCFLGFFKYFNFFVDSADALLAVAGLRALGTHLQVVLPVGISFYTFQSISYIVDVYRGEVQPARDPVDFALFVAFFPHMVAGPIMHSRDLLPQFQVERSFDRGRAVEGLRMVLWGFFKKLALADNFAVLADAGYATPVTANGPTLALATVAFALQIYCDFSAYSDIALGTAWLFGVRLMRNFNLPYFSRSVGEFWRRWHISLSSWFADYLYVPLGGGRVPRLRRAGNVMITFLLSGLWHGASWNFVLWGALNGLAVLPEILGGGGHKLRSRTTPGGERNLPSPGSVLGMLATFVFACAAWVLFRSRTLADASQVYARLWVGPWSLDGLATAVRGQELLGVLALVLLVLEWLTRRHLHPLQLAGWPRPLRWAVYTLLVWATLGLTRGGGGTFIYFQF